MNKQWVKEFFLYTTKVYGLDKMVPKKRGAILTETIFSWPGIGRYVFEAINYRDYPVIQSSILVIAFIFVMINLIVDIIYSYIDPRIKY